MKNSVEERVKEVKVGDISIQAAITSRVETGGKYDLKPHKIRKPRHRLRLFCLVLNKQNNQKKKGVLMLHEYAKKQIFKATRSCFGEHNSNKR